VTAVHESVHPRTTARYVHVVIAAASGVLTLVAIGWRTLGTFTGGGADMAHHYALVYWFSTHWSLPHTHDAALAEMTRYPPAAHVVAALVGRVVGSPFRGMQLVALGAVVLIWCAIALLLTILPGNRRWAALGALVALLVLDVHGGLLRVQVNGFEIVGNFFFAQVVGQALVWWAVWFAVRRRLAGGPPISIAAPIAVTAVLSTWIHVLPAVELLVLVGCLCADELLRRWRVGDRGARPYSPPVLLVAATAIAIVITPGFRAMRSLSANNGALDVPYLSGLASYLVLAGVVAAVSLLMLAGSVLRRSEVATAALLQGLAFAGLATALPCAAQAVALAVGDGSPYAVKKYVFGLLTTLAVGACVVASTVLVPEGAPSEARSRTAWSGAAVALVVAVAMLSVFSEKGSGYSMSRITALERHVRAVSSAAGLGRPGRGYAVDLPSSDPVLDYLFSIAVLRAPKNEVAYALLRGNALQLPTRSAYFLTAAGSRYDSSTCRDVGPREGLVVLRAGCALRAARACEPVIALGLRGFTVDPRLRGFSQPEPTGRWTDGKRASFTCMLAENRPRSPVAVAVDATAFLPAGVARQRVTMSVGPEHKSFVFTRQRPHALLQLVAKPPLPRRLTLNLTLPDAVSPQAVGLSADSRNLALFVDQIRVD
jgi:hypothetical protein